MKNKTGGSKKKVRDKSSIEIRPLLLSKSNTFIALYMLDHIPETKLSSLLFYGKLKFKEPADDGKKYLKILVLSQKRDTRDEKPKVAPTQTIHHDHFTSFFDWIFWANSGYGSQAEHKIELVKRCRIVQIPPLCLNMSEKLEAGNQNHGMLMVSITKRTLKTSTIRLPSRRQTIVVKIPKLVQNVDQLLEIDEEVQNALEGYYSTTPGLGLAIQNTD